MIERDPIFGTAPEDGISIVYLPIYGGAEPVWVPDCGEFFPGAPRKLDKERASKLLRNPNFQVYIEPPAPQVEEAAEKPSESPEASSFPKKGRRK